MWRSQATFRAALDNPPDTAFARPVEFSGLVLPVSCQCVYGMCPDSPSVSLCALYEIEKERVSGDAIAFLPAVLSTLVHINPPSPLSLALTLSFFLFL